MNSKKIKEILELVLPSHTVNFLDVFPRDKAQSLSLSDQRFPLCFVANIDPSSKPGEHWVSFFLTNPHAPEFFDSLGLPPSIYGFHITPTFQSHYPIQSLFSTVCGQYCIYFLYHRSLGSSFSDILAPFSRRDLEWNDSHVAHFVSQLVSFRYDINMN